MSGARKIGPVLATVLVANNMVGSGIFLLPATLATVGSSTIFGWIGATLGALLIGAVLAKLGQVIPRAGGPPTYAGEALGPYMGFQANMLYWITCWTGNIAIAVAAVGYLATFFPELATPLPGAIATVGFIWLLTIVNIVGPRFACQVESLTLIAGLIPILLVATAGWWYFDGRVFLDSWNVSEVSALESVPHSLVLVFWAFLGLESASVATAVVENPKRNVPLATIGGVLIAAVIYIAACSVVMGLIPAQALARSTAPFADAVAIFLGPVAGGLVALMAMIKATGTLGGWILLTAQIGKTSAERGFFPSILSRTDRNGVPAANLVMMAVLMSAVVFATMSPTLGEQFAKIIEVSVILCLLVYLYACTAVWHYHRAAPATNIGRYRLVAALAMLFCFLVILQSDRQLLALSAVAVLLTYPLYRFFARSAPNADPPVGAVSKPHDI